MNVCRAGYYSEANAENCSPTEDGKFTANDGDAQSTAADSKWAILGDIEERDCPYGDYCVGGVKTECSAGKYCPKGSSSEQTPTIGMVMNEPGLWWEKPCPSGKFCPGGVTTAPEQVTDGYWTEQGATSGTDNQCNDGYQCTNASGSIGPWEDGCPRGEWATGGAACDTA